jgi:hypothetical protein
MLQKIASCYIISSKFLGGNEVIRGDIKNNMGLIDVIWKNKYVMQFSEFETLIGFSIIRSKIPSY